MRIAAGTLAIRLYQFIQLRHIRDVLFFALGICCTLLSLTVAGVLKILRNRREELRLYSKCKGYLEYKMQAETAMASLAPTVAALTPLVGKLGTIMARHFAELNTINGDDTGRQLRVFRSTARRLDSVTREIIQKTLALNKVSDEIDEGTLNWFAWAGGSSSTRAEFTRIVPSMQALKVSVEQSVHSTESLCPLISNYKGAASDLDSAIDSHVSALTQICSVNRRIISSLERSIELLHNTEQ